MKWIGQHIWDFISRFRGDVYFEAVPDGTIASGKNLGLDSNNKLVKESDTSTTDLHGAGVNGAANQLLTDDGDGTVTSEANLTFDGDTATVSSSTSMKPEFILKSTTNDNKGSYFNFVSDKGAAGADSDGIGHITFTGDNSAQEQIDFCRISGRVNTALDTDEAGKFEFRVAAGDGNLSALRTGLELIGHGTDNEVDVNIGYGSASSTTLTGTLTMGSTLFVNNSGEVQVATQGTIDHNSLANSVAEEHYRWDNDIQSTATINHVNLSSDTGSEGEVLVLNDGNAVWGHPEKIYLQVRNDEGATIPAGAPLYSKIEIGGSGRLKVGICDANDSAKMPCIGLAEAEMNTTSTKDNFAIVSGIYNTNISGFTSLAVGDNLYIQDDGSLSQTKPTGESSLVQNVGIVLKTNGSKCQGMLVSAIGRTNDVPNLNSGYIFYGDGSNQAVSTQLSTLLPPDLTVSGTGTINANNVPTLNQNTTGTANTAVSSKGVQGGAGVDVDISSDVDINITSNGEVTVKLDADNDETSQKFKVTNNADTTVFYVQEDGDVYLSGDTITNSGSDNDLSIDCDGSMVFTIDRDDDEIGKAFSFKSFNTELVNISDRGDMQVNGVITGKIKQMFNMSFHDDIGTTKHWMPWSGTLEQNLNAYQEEVAMAMPYGGRIISCLVRAQAINSSGNLTIGIETKEPGATVGSSWTSEETETLSVGSTDANHAFHFVFGSQAHFDPGDLVAISIQSSSDLSNYTYWYVTTVVEFDLNDNLGISSAEYDTGQ